MSLRTMPIDTSQLEFRYHGASEYKAFNPDTDKREKEQARDENTGYPIYTVRCQVLFREMRESGLITVRVPLASPPPAEIEFEHPVVFEGATSKPWNMDGRDGQTWIANAMTISQGAGVDAKPATPPASNRKASKTEAAAA